MKKKLIICTTLIITGLLIFCTDNEERAVTTQIKNNLKADLDTLRRMVSDEFLPLASKGNDDSLKIAFLKCRRAYKKIEWFTEYYAPLASRELNGAPLPEIEIEENKVIPPKGFQVIEEYLYPAYNPEEKEELVKEIRTFLSILSRVESILNETELSETHIFAACKQEVFRIISLGITGFDTPLSFNGIDEGRTSLLALQSVLANFGENKELNDVIQKAANYISLNENFDKFDRIEFIKTYANPLSREISKWQKDLKIEPVQEQFALSNEATTLFDKNAVNVDFFSGNREAWQSPEKIKLGEALFNDKVVSGGARTCKSCHKPELAFTDGIPKSEALIQGRFVKRNAPTLLYAGFQNAQFYDMRSPSLENQAMDVIANKDEMHASVDEAVIRLNKLPDYYDRFKAAFPTMEKDIKPRFVMIALASYIRSLSPFNSRFDQYMRGDNKQLNQEEIKGGNLFMGKGKCATCHFMPLFNGTAPPSFTNTEAEVLGVPVKPGSDKLDSDLGRYTHYKIDELKFAFKTPTLRNIELTAPYMHNGAFNTLEEVMEFYNKGGGAGLGIELENQTLPVEKLNLSKVEEKAIIAFLKSLTDEQKDK